MLFNGVKKPHSEQLAPVAIAHDYLTQRGGAERVVLALHRAYPQATIYTGLYNAERTYPEFRDANIVVSPLNKIRFFRENHRAALPLLPLASSLLRVPAEKTIVSSSGWAHGFRFSGRSLVYCHSPARWLYLKDQYLGENSSPAVSVALKAMLPALIRWDQRAAGRANRYIANSTVIQQRIASVYGKTTDIIFPPYSIPENSAQQPIAGLQEFMADSDYFLVVSRLLPYKNVDRVIEAFAGLDHKLLVVGAGPMVDELRAAAGNNIRFVSDISDEELRYAYAHCRALLAVSHEDFGLTPLEVGAFGKPTIALKAGGYLDTIDPAINGHFIEEPTAAAIRTAVYNFQEQDWDAKAIEEHAAKFSEARFIQQVKASMDLL